MYVRQIGADAFLVRADGAPQQVFHVNKNMPRDLTQVPTLVTPHRPDPSQPGALAVSAGLLPYHQSVDEVVLMPDLTGSDIVQPWREARGSAVLLHDEAAADISFQRDMAMELTLDPSSLHISPLGSQVRRAAKFVLSQTQPETLMRIGLHWAFACEASNRPWVHDRRALGHHGLETPELDRQKIHEQAYRLVVPQMARVIALDAACIRNRADASYDPSTLSDLVRNLVAEFFPSIVNGEFPTHPEIRTAIWVLSHDSPFEIVGDNALSMLMAQTFGLRSTGEPHLAPLHWAKLTGLPDNHPYRKWKPGQAPSDLRADLRTSSGLDLRQVASAVSWQLTVMVGTQNAGNQLWTPPVLAAQGPEQHIEAMTHHLDFAQDHLVISAGELRAALLDDGDSDDTPSSAVARRKQIEMLCHERPLVQFDDGTLIPVSLADVAHRTIEMCQEAHNGQKETARRRSRRIGNILGYCFEAHVREMCHSVGNLHFAIDSTVIDEVIDRDVSKNAKRADVIIGDVDGNYLIVEVTKQNLLGGIRYADEDALERWVAEHRHKHQQTISTAEHLVKITTEAQAPPPKTISTLVVGDLPLLQSVGLSVLFETGPPFLCGITEFDRLIELGREGFHVPVIVGKWQHSGSDESLGLFLSHFLLR